jgi:hypothetical protein
MKEVNIMLNSHSETTGLIFHSAFAKGVRIRGRGSAEPVNEESRITVDGAARNVFHIKGAALLYTRVLATTPAGSVYTQAIPPNSHTDKNWAADPANDVDLDEVALDDFVLYASKNGEESTGVGYSIATAMSTTTITLDAEPATTDVWEFWTLYTDS